jgi:hypothetical protein
MQSMTAEFWTANFWIVIVCGIVLGILVFVVNKYPSDQSVKLDKLFNKRGATGGLNKRIDENREIMELIFSKAPELVSSHPWLVGWLNANDAFFTQLAEIVPPKDQTHIRALPTMNTAKLANTLSNEII